MQDAYIQVYLTWFILITDVSHTYRNLRKVITGVNAEELPLWTDSGEQTSPTFSSVVSKVSTMGTKPAQPDVKCCHLVNVMDKQS